MNLGPVTRAEVEEQDQFKYVFFALGACIEGFQAMRKVIVIYETHLKTLHVGVPIDFGVVDGEKHASWVWLLTMLKILIPYDLDLVFVFDRSESIIETVHEVYPQSKHGYCIYNLSSNVKLHV